MHPYELLDAIVKTDGKTNCTKEDSGVSDVMLNPKVQLPVWRTPVWAKDFDRLFN